MWLGLDEAGRGSVLGPLVVGACAVHPDRLPELEALGLKDSKALSPARREALVPRIRAVAARALVFRIPPRLVDAAVSRGDLNGLETRAFVRMIRRVRPAAVWIDALTSRPGRWGRALAALLPARGRPRITAESKADGRYAVVQAASILAKVARDAALTAIRARHGDVGSGYPSDPATRAFIARAQAGGAMPGCVRVSWRTLETVAAGSAALLVAVVLGLATPRPAAAAFGGAVSGDLEASASDAWTQTGSVELDPAESWSLTLEQAARHVAGEIVQGTVGGGFDARPMDRMTLNARVLRVTGDRGFRLAPAGSGALDLVPDLAADRQRLDRGSAGFGVEVFTAPADDEDALVRYARVEVGGSVARLTVPATVDGGSGLRPVDLTADRLGGSARLTVGLWGSEAGLEGTAERFADLAGAEAGALDPAAARTVARAGREAMPWRLPGAFDRMVTGTFREPVGPGLVARVSHAQARDAVTGAAGLITTVGAELDRGRWTARAGAVWVRGAGGPARYADFGLTFSF